MPFQNSEVWEPGILDGGELIGSGTPTAAPIPIPTPTPVIESPAQQVELLHPGDTVPPSAPAPVPAPAPAPAQPTPIVEAPAPKVEALKPVVEMPRISFSIETPRVMAIPFSLMGAQNFDVAKQEAKVTQTAATANMGGDWFTKNKKTLMIAGIILFVLLAAATVYSLFRDKPGPRVTGPRVKK